MYPADFASPNFVFQLLLDPTMKTTLRAAEIALWFTPPAFTESRFDRANGICGSWLAYSVTEWQSGSGGRRM
jgi:hypothetical protein